MQSSNVWPADASGILVSTDVLGPIQQQSSIDPQSNSAASAVISIILFVVAGVLEIGGGYLIWIGIRDKYKPAITLPMGGIVLVAYGFVPTLQPSSSFGRIFAVYGGFFIVLSYLWAYIFEGAHPDIGDYIGASIALGGVAIAWFYPR